jgi:hypothetical protein
MAGNPDLFEIFFSQIAKNIKKKDFIFFRSSPPKASTRRGAGKIILPRGATRRFSAIRQAWRFHPSLK